MHERPDFANELDRLPKVTPLTFAQRLREQLKMAALGVVPLSFLTVSMEVVKKTLIENSITNEQFTSLQLALIAGIGAIAIGHSLAALRRRTNL